VLCLVVSTNRVRVPESGNNGFTVGLTGPPPGLQPLSVSVTRASGDTSLTVSSNSSFTFSLLSYSPRPVTLSAAADANPPNGSAIFTVAATGLSNVLVTAVEVDKDTAPTIVSIVTLPNNGIQIQALGYPGSNYIIEAAASLSQPMSWATIATNVADGTGMLLFTTGSTNYSERFFRARKP